MFRRRFGVFCEILNVYAGCFGVSAFAPFFELVIAVLGADMTKPTHRTLLGIFRTRGLRHCSVDKLFVTDRSI